MSPVQSIFDKPCCYISTAITGLCFKLLCIALSFTADKGVEIAHYKYASTYGIC